MQSRLSPYPALSQPQYYRGYPYQYTQQYNTASTATSPTMSTYSPSSPMVQTTNYLSSAAAIPVQIPVGSLPALQALGIVPVAVASLPPADQPQPLAVLRGSTSNGTMLSLEINVSLLQSAQMNGLALVLNSLMSRGDSTTIPMSPGAGTTPYGTGPSSSSASRSVTLPTQDNAEGTNSRLGNGSGVMDQK